MAQGSVRKRGKTWYFIVPYTDAEGVYKRKWERAVAWGFPNTEHGAEQAARKRLTEIDRGAMPSAGKQTVAAWVTLHIEGARIRPNTRFLYRGRARLHILPHLGELALRDLTKARVRAWHRTLLETLKPSTVKSAHAILSASINEAVSEGVLAQNVVSLVKPPTVEREPPVVWTPEELGTFLRAAAGDEYEALWILCGVAGLRRGEALTLRWDDIDWPARRVNIRRTFTRDVNGKRIVGTTTKTKDSAAPVDVPQSCMDALREHRDRQTFAKRSRLWVDQGYIFACADGSPVPPTTINYRLHELARKAGVPRMTMKGLRHTAATFAFARGEHPKTVQAMLRHTRVGMTLDTYTHVLPSMGREAAERADAALREMQG